MNRSWIFLGLLSLLLLAGCRAEPVVVTSTPSAPLIPAPPIQAAPVSLLTLIRNPSSYDGNHIQLTGRYKPQPLLVCAGDIHQSPATWSLTDGEIEILAAGLDGALRHLASDGLTLVVEGQWQRWEGPVGCGRRSPVEQVWYLDADVIVSPNPLTAFSAEESLTIQNVPTITRVPELAEQSIIPTAILTETVEAVTTIVLATPTSAAGTPLSATVELTPLVTPTASPTSLVTPSPSTTTTVVTETPSPTTTPQVEATTGVPSSTPTLLPPAFLPIDFDDLLKNELASGQIEVWLFEASADDIVSISVAPAGDLDVWIELMSSDGSSLSMSNEGGLGDPENINEFTLPIAGTYEIQVRSVNNSEGDYAIILLSNDSLPFVVFMGNLVNGSHVSGDVPADMDHMWNFVGMAGQVITIRGSATSGEDLVLYLNGPDSIEIDFVDSDVISGPPDDSEEITEFELPITGLYSIGVGEANFNPISYSLNLEVG